MRERSVLRPAIQGEWRTRKSFVFLFTWEIYSFGNSATGSIVPTQFLFWSSGRGWRLLFTVPFDKRCADIVSSLGRPPTKIPINSINTLRNSYIACSTLNHFRGLWQSSFHLYFYFLFCSLAIGFLLSLRINIRRPCHSQSHKIITIYFAFEHLSNCVPLAVHNNNVVCFANLKNCKVRSHSRLKYRRTSSYWFTTIHEKIHFFFW